MRNRTCPGSVPRSGSMKANYASSIRRPCSPAIAVPMTSGSDAYRMSVTLSSIRLPLRPHNWRYSNSMRLSGSRCTSAPGITVRTRCSK